MRLFLIFSIFCFLFSCNSKVQVAATADEIDSLLLEKTMKTPVFKDSMLSNYVKEYEIFLKDYLTALKNEDKKQLKELQTQSEELIEKAKIVSDKLATPAQLEQYQKWMNAQQKKIQLLNTVK